jgi:hypothetical protein
MLFNCARMTLWGPRLSWILDKGSGCRFFSFHLGIQFLGHVFRLCTQASICERRAHVAAPLQGVWRANGELRNRDDGGE